MQTDILIYYDTRPAITCLANGSCYLSESLLNETLEVAGVDGLAYVLAHELAHMTKSHLRTNLHKMVKRGDLRKQLFMFNNSYTGFDAAFIDYFTNTRFTLVQEAEADLLALKVIHECGFVLT